MEMGLYTVIIYRAAGLLPQIMENLIDKMKWQLGYVGIMEGKWGSML